MFVIVLSIVLTFIHSPANAANRHPAQYTSDSKNIVQPLKVFDQVNDEIICLPVDCKVDGICTPCPVVKKMPHEVGDEKIGLFCPPDECPSDDDAGQCGPC